MFIIGMTGGIGSGKSEALKIFESLNKNVANLKSSLSVQKNIELCDAIMNSTKTYIRDFEAVSTMAIANHKNGIEKEIGRAHV